MRVLLVILLGFLCQLALAQLALAQTVVESHDTSALFLTVYPENLAMVTEVRTVDVPKGLSEIQFHGVTDMILPETAILKSFEGLRLEGNFNSQVISRTTLLQNAVGEKLTIRRFNPGTGAFDLVEAELVSASNANLNVQGAVFKTDSGLEPLQCSGLAETLVFSKVPEQLHPIPMLSMVVSAKEAGPKDITLTYLTQGIGWEADYRMDVEEGREGATLLGWLTLTNGTSKSFKDAGLSVVAGRVNRALQRNHFNGARRAGSFFPTCGDSVRREQKEEITVTSQRYGVTETVVVQEASTELVVIDGRTVERTPASTVTKVSGVRSASREQLGDYKLYRAPQSVTVKAHQTKQIAFLLKPDIEFEKVYKRSVNLKRPKDYLVLPKESDVEYEIDNSLDSNLAVPLPTGTLRLMSETENGQTLFSGEGPVDNLAVDLPFDVKLAESFLVTSVFNFETIEAADKLSLKLSTHVHNATSETVATAVEFADLKPSVIDQSNVERDPDEVHPTYRFNVGPEATETVVLDIPVELVGTLSFTPDSYGRGSRSKYEKSISTSTYRFKNRGGANPILSSLITGNRRKFVNVEARQLSKKKLNSQMEEREERFTFENSNTMPVTIEFRYFVKSGHVNIIESSLPPESDREALWYLTIPAQAEMTLTTTIRAPR